MSEVAMTGMLRCCAVCSAHILVYTDVGRDAYCNKHRPDATEWDRFIDELRIGDTVYVQPEMAWHRMSRSPHVIIDFFGVASAVVQIIGIPVSRQRVRLSDLSPRPID